MNAKAARQQALRTVIEAGDIETQGQLVAAMSAKGREVTQTTLSRDLKELGAGKSRSADGRLVYALRPVNKGGWAALARMVDSFVLEARHAGNLIVVKTMPGYAQGVAAAIDSVDEATVLGSVAGDDTILVVTADKRAAAAFITRVQGEG
jgi:transcriptional regulator of arginine metabolism